MQKSVFQQMFVIFCVLLVLPMVNPSSLAHAKKKSPPKAFSFIVEGGKASQGECDGERKIPRKLKHQKEMAKVSSYMGSELIDPEIKGKAGDEMWKHFFRSKPACNGALAKTPSSLQEAQKNSKPELPEDDSADSDDEAAPSEGPDSE